MGDGATAAIAAATPSPLVRIVADAPKKNAVGREAWPQVLFWRLFTKLVVRTR